MAPKEEEVDEVDPTEPELEDFGTAELWEELKLEPEPLSLEEEEDEEEGLSQFSHAISVFQVQYHALSSSARFCMSWRLLGLPW